MPEGSLFTNWLAIAAAVAALALFSPGLLFAGAFVGGVRLAWEPLKKFGRALAKLAGMEAVADALEKGTITEEQVAEWQAEAEVAKPGLPKQQARVVVASMNKFLAGQGLQPDAGVPGDNWFSDLANQALAGDITDHWRAIKGLLGGGDAEAPSGSTVVPDTSNIPGLGQSCGPWRHGAVGQSAQGDERQRTVCRPRQL